MDRTRLLRLVGAVLVLANGAVHLQLRFDDYGTQAIGRTFVLNAAGAAVVAALLVLRQDVLAPLAALGLTASTLLAFTLSRVGDGVLDFRETGFNPSPQAALTVGVEGAALLVLGLVLLGELRRTPLRFPHRRAG